MSFFSDIIEGLLASKPEPAAETAPASKWSSPAHHIATLDSASCECGAEKKVGDYRCASCIRSAKR